MEKPPCPSCGNRYDHTENCVAFLKLQLSEALKYAAPVNAKASVQRLKPCEHNEYWTTHSGACMACRAVVAERLNGEMLAALIALADRVSVRFGETIKYEPVATGRYLDAAYEVIAKAKATEKRVGLQQKCGCGCHTPLSMTVEYPCKSCGCERG